MEAARTQMEDSLLKCPKCAKTFQSSAHLRRHLDRKTPCDPITEPATGGHSCRYCGRGFASKGSMQRHVRQYCRIAKSDEGMEKLLDHTLAKQVKALERRLEQQAISHRELADRQSAQVAELTALLKQQLAIAPAAHQQITVEGVNTTVQNAQTIQNNITNHITIRSWGGPERISVTPSMLRTAFAENARLAEYCKLDGPDQFEPETAAPYVLEALIDLIRRAHADPEARNVYLNPRRADQVLVYEVEWKVLALVDAIRALLDGTAQGIKRIILSDADRAQLTQEVQSAAAGIPYLYEDEADEFVSKARKPLAAHLSNTAPPKALAARPSTA